MRDEAGPMKDEPKTDPPSGHEVNIVNILPKNILLSTRSRTCSKIKSKKKAK